ncbi:MAG: tetratricopeptide repeat protein [Acidipila sp.]|nr:tetratricopeptide repeat protein [Acidipila sp.]
MKTRLILSSLPAFLALSFLSAFAQRPNPHPGGMNPQPRNVTVQGFVRSAETDQPVDHVRVELHHFGGSGVNLSFTSATGEFNFPGASGGEYQIVIEQDGFEPVHQQIQVTDSISATGIVIFLHSLQGSAAKAPAGIISASRLGLPAKALKDFNLGIAELYENHNPEGSLPCFARVLEKAPTFYEAYHHTGVAYQKLHKGDEAEKALRKSIELSSGHFTESVITLASVLNDRQKFAEAETVSRQALSAVPANWAANFELSRALMGLQRPDEAEKSVQESLQANSEQPAAYLLLANIHMNRGDDASLIKDLDNFLRVDPGGPQSEKVKQLRAETMKNSAQAKAGNSSAPPK